LQGAKSLGSNGHAAISDVNGNLLFYTGNDWLTPYSLWNRNHQPLPNSNLVIISQGGNSLIVPWPGQPQKYYLFHSNNTSNSNNIPICELYSVVDMSLNNG